MKRLPILLVLVALAGLQASCRDRSGEAEGLTRQARRLTELEAKLDHIHEKMRTPLRDTAKEAAEAKQVAEATEAYVSEKQKELIALQEELEAAKREADEYRRQYVVDPSRLKNLP